MRRDQATDDTAAQQLLRLQARVDQALALARDAAYRHAANRALVDLALDVTNLLRETR